MYGTGPGYDDKIIDAEESEKRGLLRRTVWSDAKTGQYVIYPAAIEGKRSAEIIAVEKDGDPRPNKGRTGTDDPVEHLLIKSRRGDDERAYVAVATEKVYLSEKSEAEADWPLRPRSTPLFGPPPTEEEIKKRKREEATERRRKKRKEAATKP